jgi:hypothetical protein
MERNRSASRRYTKTPSSSSIVRAHSEACRVGDGAVVVNHVEAAVQAHRRRTYMAPQPVDDEGISPRR